MATAAAVALVVFAGACHAPKWTPVGISAPRALEPSAFKNDAEAKATSPVPPDFRSSMTQLTQRTLSRGHGSRFDAIVWANEAAHPGPDTLGALPDGALLIEEAIVREAGRDQPGGFLVMAKNAGTWHFDAVGADNTVANLQRAVACEECHREAKDSVFPVPTY